MKALLSVAPGGPETLVLRDVPEPLPGAGEIRVAVKAIGVNFPDTLIIEDRYQLRPPRPFAPGAECAGIVDAIGPGVEGFSVGDRVLAQKGFGSMVEKVVLEARKAARISDAMPFEEAAAFMLTYGTSYHALVDRGGLQPGETLLVLGAAGGVGLAAVEIGRALGARVVAAVSTEDKLALAKAHGAESGVVYPAGPFDPESRKALSALFKGAVGPGGAQVIYDPVGGDYAEASLRSVSRKGRFLVVGFPAGIPKLPLNLALLKECDIRGVAWGTFVEREPERHAETVRELLALYEAGQIRPQISERFPLARGAEAIAVLAARQATGKVVVTVP